MNEALKQFSKDLLKDFQAALLKHQNAEAQIKAGDGGTFKVIISTSDEDRQGDTLDQSKWKLENYLKNPVVLWAHNYGEPPIAVCTGLKLENGKLVAEGKFASAELNPFAAQIAGLYNAGFINTTSVGYIQHEDGELELLEFSFVPVPANPYALSVREVKKLNLNMAELVMKGLQFKAKSEQVGDSCELDDGTPGVLAEDEDNPGEMVCVPAGADKSAKKTMKKLTTELKAEHNRHGEEVGKAIDDFSEKCMKGEKAEDSFAKSIEEFKDVMDAEQDEHLDKCMKAIDENYELQDQKKSIEDFKSEMKAEHLKHVKCFDKAIDEFKSEGEDMDDRKEALDEFTEKAGDELDRHEKAHMDMVKEEAEKPEGEEDKSGKKGAVADEMVEDEKLQQKYNRLNRAYDVFYAFVSAYMDESVEVNDFEKLLDEAVALMKDAGTKAKGVLKKHLDLKSGRQISAKNKEKIGAIIKAIEDYKTAHTEAHEKAADEVIASLKDLMGPEDDDGEETKPDKKGAAPEQRPRSAGAAINKDAEPDNMSDFEAFMFTRNLLRTVNSATAKGLEKMNKKFKEEFPNRR